MSPPIDRAWIQSPAWDDLAELLAPIHEDVQAFARRIARSSGDGDDLFQEAVLRAAHKLGSLRERARFRAWMYSVVISLHRTRCRRAFWRRLVGSDEVDVADAVGDDGSTWADARASADRATAALQTLRPEQREAIVLFELHGYAIEEIAALQGSSVPAVKSRLTRGRERLRQFYARLAPAGADAPSPAEVCRD